MDTNIQTKATFDSKLSGAGSTVFGILFRDSNGEISTIINKCLNEKGEDKEKAFALLVGFSQTGLVDVETITTILSRISSSEKDKHPVLVRSYMQSNPKDSDCVSLMDAIKDSHPELLAEIIKQKKEWSKADIRRHLTKYTFTEKLWIALAEIEEDLRNRK